MSLLITDAVVVPVRPADTVIRHGAVAVDDSGRISAVGPARDLAAGTYDQVIDAAGGILLPGFVNAHGHAVQTLYKGTIERRPLELWRQYVKARDRCVTGRDIELGVLLSAIELLRSGCTTTLEHYYSGIDEPHMGAAHVLHAWQEIGIRGVFAPMLTDVAYEQTVPIKVDAATGKGREEIDRISSSEGAETLDGARTFIETHLGASPLITFLLGPSAPHRCSADLIEGCAQAAEELGIGWHMHVGETRKQYAHTRDTLGATPVGLLDRLGVLSARASFAHVVWCSDEDLDRLAETGVTVVHNPASNLKLGSGIAPVPAMLRRGIPVALGTDGSASNDSQSMLEAMKLAALLHRAGQIPFEEWPTSADALDMATVGGARALGLAADCGTIETGRQADLVLLSSDVPSLVPLNDPIRQVVHGPATDAVSDVWVGGHRVIADGELQTVDEAALYAEVRERVAALADTFHEAERGVRELEPLLARLYEES